MKKILPLFFAILELTADSDASQDLEFQWWIHIKIIIYFLTYKSK
jgi:hypothetical protein